MKKPVYKLLDEKGRVLIPLEMRQKAEIEKGDILKVSINTGKIVISKVDILEVGKQEVSRHMNFIIMIQKYAGKHFWRKNQCQTVRGNA